LLLIQIRIGSIYRPGKSTVSYSMFSWWTTERDTFQNSSSSTFSIDFRQTSNSQQW